MATFCGKKVQLSNVRARFMSVKPGKRFKFDQNDVHWWRLDRGAIVISEPKISVKMVTKSGFRASAF